MNGIYSYVVKVYGVILSCKTGYWICLVLSGSFKNARITVVEGLGWAWVAVR